MRLNLKDIIHVPGAVRPFSFRLDLSDLEFGGAHPIGRPVTVEGRVRNMARCSGSGGGGQDHTGLDLRPMH